MELTDADILSLYPRMKFPPVAFNDGGGLTPEQIKMRKSYERKCLKEWQSMPFGPEHYMFKAARKKFPQLAMRVTETGNKKFAGSTGTQSVRPKSQQHLLEDQLLFNPQSLLEPNTAHKRASAKEFRQGKEDLASAMREELPLRTMPKKDSTQVQIMKRAVPALTIDTARMPPWARNFTDPAKSAIVLSVINGCGLDTTIAKAMQVLPGVPGDLAGGIGYNYPLVVAMLSEGNSTGITLGAAICLKQCFEECIASQGCAHHVSAWNKVLREGYEYALQSMGKGIQRIQFPAPQMLDWDPSREEFSHGSEGPGFTLKEGKPVLRFHGSAQHRQEIGTIQASDPQVSFQNAEVESLIRLFAVAEVLRLVNGVPCFLSTKNGPRVMNSEFVGFRNHCCADHQVVLIEGKLSLRNHHGWSDSVTLSIPHHWFCVLDAGIDLHCISIEPCADEVDSIASGIPGNAKTSYDLDRIWTKRKRPGRYS